MARLRHKVTGVVVNVDDETAKTLDGFEPAEKKAPAPRKAAVKKSE